MTDRVIMTTPGSRQSLQEQCVQLYEAILEDVRAGRLLSHVGLTLLQHHVYNEMRDKRVPAVREDEMSEVCVEKLLQMRLDAMTRQRFTVLVAGEYNAGKSTFLNILMGGDYLPMNRGKITKVVCEIRNDVKRKATLCFLDKSTVKSLDLSENTQTTNWKALRECIKNPVYNRKSLSRIIIQWPFPRLQDIHTLTLARQSGTASSTQPMSVPRPNIDTDIQTDTHTNTDSDFSVSHDRTHMPVEADVHYPPISLVNQTSSPNTHAVGSTDSSFIQVTGNNRVSPGHIHVNKGNHDNRDAARCSEGDNYNYSTSRVHVHSPPGAAAANITPSESTNSGIDSDDNKPVIIYSRRDNQASAKIEHNSIGAAGEDNDTRYDSVDKEADRKSNNSYDKETTKQQAAYATSDDTEAARTTQDTSITKQGTNSNGQKRSTQQLPHSTNIDNQTDNGTHSKLSNKSTKLSRAAMSLDSFLYGRRGWHTPLNQDTNIEPRRPQLFMQAPVSDSSTSSSDLSDSNRSGEHLNAGPAGMQKLEIPIPITFIDCPGVDENSMATSIQTVVAELDNCDAFIFLVDTIASDLGVRRQGILKIAQSISTKLACSARHFNADTALFLANKIDEYDPRAAEAEVLERLNKLLPMVNKDHIGSITANKVLRRLLKHNMQSYEEVAGRTVNLLQTAYDAKIEENTLWLLKVTEMAKQISCIPSIPLYSKLRSKLGEDRQKAVKLQDIEQNKRKREDRLLDKRNQDIHTILCMEKTQIINIDWDARWRHELGTEPNNINPGDWRTWYNVFRRLHKIINEEILKIDDIKEKLTKVNDTFVNELNLIYKSEIESLELLKANFTTGYEVEEKPSVLKQIPNVLMPVALDAVFRLTPIGLGVTLMLTPLLPAVWLVIAWKEEYEDHQFLQQLDKFMINKTNYVQEMVNDHLVIDNSTKTTKYLNDTRLLKREDIHKQSLELIAVIDFLLCSDHKATDEHKQLNTQHYESVCKFYSKHYLDDSNRDRAGSRQASGDSGPMGGTEAEGALEVRLHLHATDGHQPITVHECMILRQMRMNTNTLRLMGLLHSKYQENDGRHVLDVAFKSGAEGRYNLTWVIRQERTQLQQQRQHQKQVADIATIAREFVHYARECCECLKALHDMNIVHGRVNPANFVLVDCGDDPLGRYGIKMRVKDFPEFQSDVDAYDAPELCSIKISVTKSSDIFSLGLVFMELWFRKFINSIPKKGNMYQAPENASVSKMIAGCLCVDPRRRPNIDSLLDAVCELGFQF